MKLLYITNGINGAGGLERVLSIKASKLAEEYAYDVKIICLNDQHLNPFYKFSDKIRIASISVNGNPIQYILSYKNGIQKQIDDFNPDIISVCDDGLKGFFLPLIIKSKSKWIYERHVSKLIELKENESFISKKIKNWKWTLMEILGKKFSKFVVLTEGNAKEWKSLQNLLVIPNPLPFYPTNSSTLENKTAISVGRISYQKGQDNLLKAWEIVHKKHPEWQLHLYGKENLNFIDTNNLKNNVHFFHPVENIQDKLLESSIYVMSSRFEGFGMVLIEAMSCGLPCVSYDCNYGPSDIINPGKDGILVPNQDFNKLADSIINLIENQQKRKSMGMKARKNVERFSSEKIVSEWDELFRILMP
jgi:glycosyltransferase involved in cell wall biosynthesis